MNSIKLFYDDDVFAYFMKSEAVKFWSDRGHPFVKLSADECMRHIPSLGNLVYMVISYININCAAKNSFKEYNNNFFVLDEHSRYGKSTQITIR